MSQTDAYIKAGYNVADRSIAAINASQLLALPNVSYELDRLNAKRQEIIVSNEINNCLSKEEKRTILAEIARANLVDFQDDDGTPKLDKDTPHNKAAREYYHRVKYDRDGQPIITKSIKLTDAIEAIREDNKMTGDYAPSKHMVAQKVVFEIEQVDKKKRGED